MSGVLAAAAERVRTLPKRHGRVTLAILALILVAGFALRVEKVIDPLEDPGDDAAAYFSLAKSLYVEGSYGGESFRDAGDWSPGAPLMYAGVYYLTGGVRDSAARLLEALFGVAAIVVVYLIGRRLSGRPTGLLAATGVALYPSFIYSTGALLSEPPAIFTLPAAVLATLWASERRTPWAWALPGLLFGLTALIRPEYLLVTVAFVALVGLRQARARGLRPGVAAAAVLAVAAMVPVLPWTVRNAIVLDRFVPVSTGAGKAIYVGSFLPADGEYQRVKVFLVERFRGRRLEPGSGALDRVNPRPLFDRVAARHPELPRDSALGRIGKDNLWRYLRDDPLDYAAMLVRKTWRMWGTGFGPDMETTGGRILQRVLLGLAVGGLAVLVWRRRWWMLAVLATPLVLVTATAAVTLAPTRRNEILMTLVIPLAATAVACSGAFLRERVRPRLSSPPRCAPPPASSPPS